MYRLMKRMPWLGLLGLMLLLSACAAAEKTSTTALTWQITVAESQKKETLTTTEVVTQYNGTKSDVVHEQSPASGNIYLIMNLTVQKTGSQSVPFQWKDLTVRDANGAVYARHENDSFLEQHQYTPRMTGLDLRLGKEQGWVCYEIPASAAQGKLTLVYTTDEGQQEIPLP